MEIFKNLLSLGITVGLSDRQQFVEKVSQLIEQYQQNPENAEHLAEGIVQYFEQLRQDIRIQQNLKGAMPTEDINRLTEAIEKLTNELKKH